MRSITTAALALLAAALTPGCATLFSGTSEQVTIDSEPEGARIFVEGIERGRTPATISVKRPGFNDTEVTLQLEGYEDRTFTLQKGFNTISILNLFVPAGFIVDAVTGAITQYDPNTYTVTLDQARGAYLLDELERDEAGRYVIPALNGPITVTDEARGLNIVFE